MDKEYDNDAASMSHYYTQFAVFNSGRIETALLNYFERKELPSSAERLSSFKVKYYFSL